MICGNIIGRYIVLLIIFLIGCTGGPHTLAIEGEFTELEVEMIHSAIGEWVAATDSADAAVFTLVERFYPEEPFTIEQWNRDAEYGKMYKIHETDPGYKDLLDELDKDQFLGIANDYTGNIAIMTDRFGADFAFRKVMLHELGHIYGLKHTTYGIMGKLKDTVGFGEGSDCLRQVDVDQFCDINYCGPNAHATCES